MRDRILGGFFTTPTTDLTAALAASQVRLLIADPSGPIAHQGATYRLAEPSDGLTWSVVSRSFGFGSGAVDGLTIEILVGGNPTTFAQWRSLHFANPADLANDAISGPAASPAGDGISNLLRYAHGVGPLAPISALLPVLVAAENGEFQYRFRYDPTKTDLVWQVKATTDLTDWPHLLFDSGSSAIPPLVDGWLAVPMPVSLTGGTVRDPQQFARLVVMLQSAP